MKDYCYRKIKKQYKVFPSAYASGAIVRCRRRLGKNRFSLEKKYGLHGWFMRGGGKGWVDCKTGKPCGRKKGEKRKYPACRPTMKMCNSAMRKKMGRKRISWVRKNPAESYEPDIFDLERWAIMSKDPEVSKFYDVARYLDYERLYPLLLKLWKSKGSEKIWENPVPPKAVSRVACRGLAKRRKYKRGGTAVGVARARDLCNRRNVTMKTIRRIQSYFRRHRASRDESYRRIHDPVSPARIADELWGGTPGYRWAKQILG